MVVIKKIISDIYDELEGAEEYAKFAIKHKEDMPETAAVYYEISLVEIEHVNKLHDEIVRIIAQYRLEVGDPPPEMQILYDYEHEKAIDKAQKVKILQAMY